MKSVFFGTAALRVNKGNRTRIAINKNKQVVQVLTGASTDYPKKLYYSFGYVDGTELTPSFNVLDLIGAADMGIEPSVAINDSYAIEVHWDDSNPGHLWYYLGQLTKVPGTHIVWSRYGGGAINYNKSIASDGYRPAVAINDHNRIVEVHQSQSGTSGLWYWTGQVVTDSVMNTTQVIWEKNAAICRDGSTTPNQGSSPSVAINTEGLIVEVHDSGDSSTPTLWYWIGKLDPDGKTIHWLNNDKYDNGCYPTVALSDSGDVIETHQANRSDARLFQRVGKVVVNNNVPSIQWEDIFAQGTLAYEYDLGRSPSVAFNGVIAVQSHLSSSEDTLWATASYWLDRATWMTDNARVLGDQPLAKLVMPGSHDSAMYDYPQIWNPWTYGNGTQSLNITGQLMAGIRYFDLRVMKDGSDKQFKTYHGGLWGPSLDTVMKAISEFLAPNKELIIVKLSHFNPGSDCPSGAQPIVTKKDFEQLCTSLYSGLGKWLYDSKPADRRFGQVTLSQFTVGKRPVLAVLETSADNISAGSATTGQLWQYLDWSAENPTNPGALTVFDVYSQTQSDPDPYNAMVHSTTPDVDQPILPTGQFPKFKYFNQHDGMCKDGKTMCDLFLLSFTLTQSGQPTYAGCLCGRLGEQLATDGYKYPWPSRPMGVLYTNFSQYSRGVDIALALNGCL
jgi:hypothetical protein